MRCSNHRSATTCGARARSDTGDKRSRRAALQLAKDIPAKAGICASFSADAVSKGKIFQSKGTVIGEGLVRAYHLESSSAIYPRVVIDPQLVKLMLSDTKELSDYALAWRGQTFRQDADGMYFCDYLGIDLGEVERDWPARLETVAQFVEAEIANTADTRVLQKLIWLRTYIQKSRACLKEPPLYVLPHETEGDLERKFPRRVSKELRQKLEKELIERAH
jgi:hypothetical protein